MCMLIIFMMGCTESSDNNGSLDFDVLNVKFEGALTGKSWATGDEIGIFSSCTRGDTQNVGMSANTNARYTAEVEGEETYFGEASENDRIEAIAGDHNFKFYAYFPYSDTVEDISAIPAQLPATQLYTTSPEEFGFYVANKQLTTVVPTVGLDFKGIFSTVELYLPNDILDGEENTTVRKLSLKPAVSENFEGVLVDGGTYNLETGEFTSDAEKQGDMVQVDFGETGIKLVESFTKVKLSVAPFTVPSGGMDVVLTDMSGNETTVNILSAEEDEGTVLAAGEVMTQYLSKDNDGIIPVTFPVVFPLGKTNDVANFTKTNQPRWETEGIWTNPEQTQAYAQWHKQSDPAPSPIQFLETVNSGEISSPGIKGIWTGDYLEFVLPVKKFEAGTAVTVKFPMYTRQGPVFWNIEYLDGEEWKSNKTEITCYDPAYTREATFSLVRGGKIIEHTMVFSEAVESGNIKIRISCADGSIQADTDTTVAERTTPWTSGSSYGAPFYLYLAGSDVSSVTFSID